MQETSALFPLKGTITFPRIQDVEDCSCQTGGVSDESPTEGVSRPEASERKKRENLSRQWRGRGETTTHRPDVLSSLWCTRDALSAKRENVCSAANLDALQVQVPAAAAER